MNRLENLKTKIDALYLAKNPERTEWADWLHTNHIYIVAKKAGILADRFGAHKELAMAAAMLHDVADAVMSRFALKHEEESLHIARNLLKESGFTEEEIKIVVDDAIAKHSCHNGKAPQTLEGKAMATADALAHLQTNFYEFAFHSMSKEKTPAEIAQWALPKIERDFQDKILFEEVREEARPAYEKLAVEFQAYT